MLDSLIRLASCPAGEQGVGVAGQVIGQITNGTGSFADLFQSVCQVASQWCVRCQQVPHVFNCQSQFGGRLSCFVKHLGCILAEWTDLGSKFCGEQMGLFKRLEKGKPIGYPRLEVTTTDAELKLPENIYGDRREALLIMWWAPEASSGW